MLKTIKVKAWIDGEFKYIRMNVSNYKYFIKQYSCNPVVYPYGLCCDKPNPRVEQLTFCAKERERIMEGKLVDERITLMIERARQFFKQLKDPKQVKLVRIEKYRWAPPVYVVRLIDDQRFYSANDIIISKYGRLWGLGSSYAVKHMIEAWCNEYYNSKSKLLIRLLEKKEPYVDCYTYNGAAIIGAALEGYILSLDIPNPIILIPDPEWPNRLNKETAQVVYG